MNQVIFHGQNTIIARSCGRLRIAMRFRSLSTLWLVDRREGIPIIAASMGDHALSISYRTGRYVGPQASTTSELDFTGS